MIFLFLQCVSTVIILYIIISPQNSYLYIHWILDLNKYYYYYIYIYIQSNSYYLYKIPYKIKINIKQINMILQIMFYNKSDIHNYILLPSYVFLDSSFECE